MSGWIDAASITAMLQIIIGGLIWSFLVFPPEEKEEKTVLAIHMGCLPGMTILLIGAFVALVKFIVVFSWWKYFVIVL